MNLSSVASALGAGYEGYGVDQQEALRKATLQKQQDDADQDRMNRLLMAGYRPQTTPNPALNAALSGATGQGNIPLQTGMTGGTTPAPKPLDAALARAAASPATPSAPMGQPAPPPGPAPLTITTRTGGPQTLAFDYDSSPEGMKERRDRAKEVEETTRQQTLAKQKADEAQTEHLAAQTRAFGSLKRYFPTDPSAQQPFDAANNDYVKSFNDLETQDRATRGQIAASDAAAKSQTALAERQATLENGKIRESEDPITHVKTYSRFDPATNTMVPIAGAAPKNTAAGSAQNAPQMAAAKANLESAMTNMTAFENKLKAGQATYSPEDATLASLASSPTANTAGGVMGGVSAEISNRALAKLQQSNPDLWQYVTNKKYVAEAILNTHKRPNQTQYEIEQELSGAGPTSDATTEGYGKQIDMGASRRQRMYQDVFGGSTPNASGTPSGNGAGKNTQRAARWDALVASGMDKASATAQVQREIP